MEHPSKYFNRKSSCVKAKCSNNVSERQVSHVIHLLTEGSPADQRDALEAYFLPDATFVHPLCRVPSFSHVSLPFIGEINSRWVIWMIYRWYKILSPRILLDVECGGMFLSALQLRQSNICMQSSTKNPKSSSWKFIKYSPFSSCHSTNPMFISPQNCNSSMPKTIRNTTSSLRKTYISPTRS